MYELGCEPLRIGLPRNLRRHVSALTRPIQAKTKQPMPVARRYGREEQPRAQPELSLVLPEYEERLPEVLLPMRLECKLPVTDLRHPIRKPGRRASPLPPGRPERAHGPLNAIHQAVMNFDAKL